jgi:leader peptidase (prepilin peptidase) / N-methyltransferase
VLDEPKPESLPAEPELTGPISTGPISAGSQQLEPSLPAAPNRPLKYLWLSILGIVGFYVFLLPEIQIAWWNYRTPNRMLPSFLQLDFVTRSLLRTLEAFVVAFFFAVGASFGSFLNVVAYRLPHHLDISVSGSRCPNCNKRLSFKENMPIFGWLSLRGKCSGCQIPIPFKYLAAEMLLGFIAVWLGAYELLSGGINLPLRTPNFYAGVVWIVFYTKWDLVSYTLFHFALFCILSTQILILDNNLKVPKRFITFSLLLGISLSLCFPWLLLVHSSLYLPGIEMRSPGQLEGVKPEWMYSSLQSVAMGCLYSIAVAMPAAAIATLICRQDKNQNFLTWLGTFGCIGIWLGWQATVLVAGISLLVSSAWLYWIRTPSRKSLHLSIIILIVAVLHHTFWNYAINLLLKYLS